MKDFGSEAATAQCGRPALSRGRRSWPAWRSALVALLLVAGSPLLPSPAEAEDRIITLEVMLSHISNEPGPIDKRAARLSEKIRKDFRFESLRVLETKTMRLGINHVGSMTLPTGSRLRVTPMLIDERGALLAIDLEGSAKADLRVKRHHLIVIGAQSYKGGKLLVSLDPDF